MACKEDSLRAAAGVMRYLEDGKVSIRHLSGVPFMFGHGSVREARKSFLVSLLWVHKKTFPHARTIHCPIPRDGTCYRYGPGLDGEEKLISLSVLP
jgi:hypothetical protein